MKKVSFFLIIAFAVLGSCSPEDEPDKIVSAQIAYVHENGTAVLAGECISPNAGYAIAITPKFNKKRNSYTPTEVRYTLNGIEHVMIFSKSGRQLQNVKLANGINQAQIVGTNNKTQISLYSHDNFELVK